MFKVGDFVSHTDTHPKWQTTHVYEVTVVHHYGICIDIRDVFSPVPEWDGIYRGVFAALFRKATDKETALAVAKKIAG